MVIYDNYLLLSKASEFDNKLIKYFYNRLQIFLCIKDSNVPHVICSSRDSIIQRYRTEAGLSETESARAFVCEASQTIVFDARRYNFKSDNSFVSKSDISEPEKYDFKYVIPLSDIYHELIHHIQFSYINNDYVNFLEAGADLYAYIITGQWNMDYLDAVIAFWYVSTKVCRNNETQFYILLRDAIVDDDFLHRYWMSNKNFVKLVAKHYDGNINTFLLHFKKDFGNREYESEFYSYLKKIHNLIFYKY